MAPVQLLLDQDGWDPSLACRSPGSSQEIVASGYKVLIEERISFFNSFCAFANFLWKELKELKHESNAKQVVSALFNKGRYLYWAREAYRQFS